MPVQSSPPERQTRTQAVLTPTPKAPPYGTPAVPQLRAHLTKDKTKLNSHGEYYAEEEDNSMEKEESVSTEASLTPVVEYEGT
ncbi:hypothetical protein O181_031481 [Austropuccinia psidii MF-1]|uniref:Uncharacterized protein n=1 Tax=Austropuccinia psidii MF-1 TaxID=1389203 RepID=A0A9Q3D0J9_9BASI|nr:hypothetical protein [Austropuccinia psidii MF-1]